MRKVSSVVVVALAAVGFGATAASAQDVFLQKDQSLATSFAPSQPIRLGAGGQAFAPSPAAATAQVSTGDRSQPAGAMTAPTAPGSGTAISFASTPDIAQGMSAGAFSKEQPGQGSFSTASAEPNEVGPSGVPPMLGVDLTTGATTSFSVAVPTGPVIQLRR